MFSGTQTLFLLYFIKVIFSSIKQTTLLIPFPSHFLVFSLPNMHTNTHSPLNNCLHLNNYHYLHQNDDRKQWLRTMNIIIHRITLSRQNLINIFSHLYFWQETPHFIFIYTYIIFSPCVRKWEMFYRKVCCFSRPCWVQIDLMRIPVQRGGFGGGQVQQVRKEGEVAESVCVCVGVGVWWRRRRRR